MIKYTINNKLEILTLEGKKIGDSMLQGENRDSLYVSAPINREGIKFLYLSDKIKVIYYGEENKIYEFNSEVVERKKDQIILFGIKKPTKYSVVQRRQAVRILIALHLSYAPMDIEKYKKDRLPAFPILKEEFKGKISKCLTYDLSAGGIGGYLPDSIKEGDWVVLFFDAEEIQTAAVGLVIRARRDNKVDKNLRNVGIQFVNGTPRYEDILFQFIFKKMREQIQVKELFGKDNFK